MAALVLGAGLASAALAQEAAPSLGSNMMPDRTPPEICRIAQLDCAKSGSKCNIKFRNRTGVQEPTGCYGKSAAQATKVRVAAQDVNGKDLGNDLTIEAGATNTMNLENKKKTGFMSIRVSSPDNMLAKDVSLSCAQIKQILAKDATCKVYIDYNENSDKETDKFHVALVCNGGEVCVRQAP